MKNKTIYLWVRPVVVWYTLIGITTLMITKAGSIYSESEVTLPRLTQAVILIGGFISTFWMFLSIIAAIVLLSGVAFFLKTSIGRLVWKRLPVLFHPLTKMDKLVASDIKHIVFLTVFGLIIFSILLPLYELGH